MSSNLLIAQEIKEILDATVDCRTLPSYMLRHMELRLKINIHTTDTTILAKKMDQELSLLNPTLMYHKMILMPF